MKSYRRWGGGSRLKTVGGEIVHIGGMSKLMDFVTVMLFIQQVFHLECLVLFCFFLCLRLLYYYFRSNHQPGVAHKHDIYKKTCSIVFYSSTDDEITFPHEFIFVFVWSDIVKKKVVVKSGVLEKK